MGFLRLYIRFQLQVKIHLMATSKLVLILLKNIAHFKPFYRIHEFVLFQILVKYGLHPMYRLLHKTFEFSTLVVRDVIRLPHIIYEFGVDNFLRSNPFSVC